VSFWRHPVKLWPESLFGRTAATLGLAFVLFQTAALALVAFTVLIPMAQRSADDLAALIVLSAQTWAELPPETRPAFEQELAEHHHLRISEIDNPADVPADRFLNSRNIETALSRRTGQQINLEAGENGWVWADLQMGGHYIHIGFEKNRYNIHSPLAAVGLVSLGALLIWLTAMLTVRRITRMLAQLGAAAGQVGQGQMPQPLAEKGATELVTLARAFNQMANEVQALLANRTTLLAGISHDLRTPIARMRLAIAMLPADANPALVEQIERDLEQMNELIGGFLDMARGLQSEVKQHADLCTVIQQIAVDASRGGRNVICNVNGAYESDIALHALQRIVVNLIENALRYAPDSVVEVTCVPQKHGALIQVLDRGPGIPAEQLEAVFRPFYRLESSRNLATGGSGLGLAISRQLAQANGWQLALSAREGGGLVASLQI
jgi:two-component system, OmpR family, osmolarity sensor histidine kinase EnvZ